MYEEKGDNKNAIKYYNMAQTFSIDKDLIKKKINKLEKKMS